MGNCGGMHCNRNSFDSEIPDKNTMVASGIYSKTPVTRTRITQLSPISLGFDPNFSHFYSVNSNSGNSNSPLTRTKFRFPWSKFTLITRILVLATHHGCPVKYRISCSCRVIGKNTKTNTTQQVDFNRCNEQITYLTVSISELHSVFCIIIRMHNRVTVSDEIQFNLQCTA